MGSGVEEAGGSPHAWGRVPASPLGGNPVSAAAPNLPYLSLSLSLFLALLSLHNCRSGTRDCRALTVRL